MSQKMIKITGWSLTILIGLVLSMSAFMKLSQNEESIQQAAYFGFTPGTMLIIGLIEIGSLILFIIPRTGIVGTLLLAAYIGGAIATHVQHDQSFAVPVIVEIFIWITAFIRFPELRHRIYSGK